jgi:myosin heavy subunit
MAGVSYAGRSSNIAKSDVIAAVETLRGEGRAPTLRAVRETIGRGSLSTINPWLREILSGEQAAAPEADALMKPVLGVLADVTKKAVASATEQQSQEIDKLQKDLEYAADEIARVEAEKKVLEESVDALQEEAGRSRVALEGKDGSIAELKAELVGVREELRKAQADLARVTFREEDLKEAKSKADEALKETARLEERLTGRDREIERIQSELEKAREQAAEAQKKAAELLVRLEEREKQAASAEPAEKHLKPEEAVKESASEAAADGEPQPPKKRGRPKIS